MTLDGCRGCHNASGNAIEALKVNNARIRQIRTFGYGLYADGVWLASFAESRMSYRDWARRSGRMGDIHSLEDRYDHDVDELMAQAHLLIERVGQTTCLLPRSSMLRLALAVIDPRSVT